jgi:hypothetical protein
MSTASQLPSMVSSRGYFQPDILSNGKIFVSGGEYRSSDAGTMAEMYDPVANTWTQLPAPTTVYPDVNLIDGESIVLPNGHVLVYAVRGSDCIDNGAGVFEGSTLIFNTVTNTWSAAPCSIGNQDETSWLQLRDQSILALDLYTTTSEATFP